MELTTDTFVKYKGGQMEIQNQGEGYIYRGEIKTIAVEDDTLTVSFAWLAKGDSFPPTKWESEANLTYCASLQLYAISDIGEERISLNSPIIGELVVLFPPNGSKLDPAKVEGLKLG
jgi:hypothetical protein